MAEPLTKCGACEQVDDHPKHQILVGFNNPNTEGQMFHPHDFGREGQVFYHFDCPSKWHAEVADPLHRRIIALAESGVHGDELRARIVGGTV
jgi:hypothetical protein